MEVIVGTYEEFLLGYKLDTKNEKDELVQSFADKSHAGAVKCLAVHGHFIATGATDDRIFIYDMRTRKQTQIILSHEGTINALAFTPDNSHLLSGSDDGRMIATRLNTWATEGNWKAHNGTAVTHISCHPSGKMALSLGGDRVLRTWNLVKGRVAYRTNLKGRDTLGAQPDCLTWSPSGDYFTLCGQRAIEIWSIKTANVEHCQKTTAKPVSVCWLADMVCVGGLEDGKLLWIDLENSGETLIEVHTSRVKAIAYQDDCLVTACSSGEIKLWEVNLQRKKLKLITTVNTGCRPTCLGILNLKQFGSNYRIGSEPVVENQKTIKTTEKYLQPQQRGVVTIEYEDDDADADEATIDEADATKESENDKEHIDEDGEENSDDDMSTDDTENSENESADEEPKVKLPKSRKRKQVVLQSQEKKSKLSKEQKKTKKFKTKNSMNKP